MSNLSGIQTTSSVPLYKRILRIILPALLIATLMLMSDWYRPDVYDGDEGLWLAVSAHAFKAFFIDHDASTPFWRERFFVWGSYHPQIGKYIIGMGIFLAGQHNVPFTAFDFQQSLEWNQANGKLQVPEVVIPGRSIVLLTAFISCMLFFILIRLVAGQLTAYLAVGWLVGAKLLVLSSSRALIDTPALMFSLFALVACIYLLQALHADLPGKAVFWNIVVGSACGAAAATKMNHLLTLGICGLMLGIVALSANNNRLRITALLHGIGITCWAWGIFFISNPFLYPDPLNGTQHMLSLADFINAREFEWKTATISAKIWAVQHLSRYFAPFNQLNLPIDPLIVLIGVVLLGYRLVNGPSKAQDQSLVLIALWIAVTFIGTLIWLPAAYPRYVLPLQPCFAFLGSYALAEIVQWLFAQFKKHSPPSSLA